MPHPRSHATASFVHEYDNDHIQSRTTHRSPTMKIRNAVALVTGANRGIGLAFTRELLARGARTVYGAARDPSTITLPGVTPLALDVTRPEQVAAAAARASDVTLLINNAGIGHVGGFLAADSEE